MAWRSPALWLAAILFGIAVTSIRGFGVVGEVAAAWGLDDPPPVVVDVRDGAPVWADPSRDPNAGHRLALGPLALDAAQVRPIESLVLGPVRIPLAVNAYTGGLWDVPARLLASVAGVRGGLAAGPLLGFGLVVAVWATLRRHGSMVGAGVAALWLATDWNFVFYRVALGGTEVGLLAGSVLIAAGLWDRRWRGGALAPWALALGLAFGLHAKITFVSLLAGALVASLLTRWDRGGMGAPLPIAPRVRWLALAIVGAGLLPLVVAALHHGLAVPEAPHIRSHDFPGLQVRRLLTGWSALTDGARAPSREQAANVVSFVLQPLGFFPRACGAAPEPAVAVGRALGLLVVLAGTALAWTDRAKADADALLRWCSLAVPTACAAAFLLNRDAHHLAPTTAWMAIWAGLAIDRVAATATPPRSNARGRLALALALPWLGSGVMAARRTNAVLATCTTPTILASGQGALVAALRGATGPVVVVDYDLYGAVDVLAPEIQWIHGWGAMSHTDDRRGTFAELATLARGGHLVVTEASAPTIYGFSPDDADTRALLATKGLTVSGWVTLPDGDRIYAIAP